MQHKIQAEGGAINNGKKCTHVLVVAYTNLLQAEKVKIHRNHCRIRVLGFRLQALLHNNKIDSSVATQRSACGTIWFQTYRA